MKQPPTTVLEAALLELTVRPNLDYFLARILGRKVNGQGQGYIWQSAYWRGKWYLTQFKEERR